MERDEADTECREGFGRPEEAVSRGPVGSEAFPFPGEGRGMAAWRACASPGQDSCQALGKGQASEQKGSLRGLARPSPLPSFAYGAGRR